MSQGTPIARWRRVAMVVVGRRRSRVSLRSPGPDQLAGLSWGASFLAATFVAAAIAIGTRISRASIFSSSFIVFLLGEVRGR